MKKILILTFCVLFVKLTFSQVLISLLFGEQLNKGPLEFGIDLSWNSSIITNIENPERLSRLGFGLYMTHNLNDKIGFDYALFFNSPKGSGGMQAEDLFWEVNPILTNGKLERRLEYFELPVEFFYKLNSRFALAGGGYVAYLHGTKDRITTDINFGANRFERSITGEMNRLDAGVSFHLKYHFIGQPGVQLKMGYQRGLVDIYKSDELTAYNETIQFSVLIPIKMGL